jgi:cellulose synthase/poly-beta-1,6-N-acetylglucosamine synthase-like glycosyltransferase
MKDTIITVGVIVRNEEKYIEETLNSILNSNYPAANYEILVIDGNSTDSTQKIVRDKVKKSKNIRLVVEPWKKGTHGMARNLAAARAKGKYLAFTDGDCIVRKDWLKTLFESIEKERKLNSKVVAVGGLRLPVRTVNWKENLINHVMGTFFGSGGSKGFTPSRKKYVDSIPNYNAIYLKDIIRKYRYSNLGIGEDYEFNQRLNTLGYRLVFNKNAIIYHHQEGSFKNLCRQAFRYGKAQVEICRKIKKIRYFALIAPLFVFSLVFGALLSIFSQVILLIYLNVIGLYITLDIFYSLIVLGRIKKLYGLASLFTYPLIHISYGSGVLWRLVFQKSKKG